MTGEACEYVLVAVHERCLLSCKHVCLKQKSFTALKRENQPPTQVPSAVISVCILCNEQ
jgi:hypothetical protein